MGHAKQEVGKAKYITFIKSYGPKRIIWFWRFNAHWDRELKVFEMTFGLFGFGFLAYVRKNKLYEQYDKR